MEYKIESEGEEPTTLHTFQGSVDLINETGKITLSWDEVLKLKHLLPKAIKDAIATYWPEEG